VPDVTSDRLDHRIEQIGAAMDIADNLKPSGLGQCWAAGQGPAMKLSGGSASV
jgi:hypothetical protein